MPEDAAYYFAGQKSLEEVTDIIRSRMGLTAEAKSKIGGIQLDKKCQ